MDQDKNEDTNDPSSGPSTSPGHQVQTPLLPPSILYNPVSSQSSQLPYHGLPTPSLSPPPHPPPFSPPAQRPSSKLQLETSLESMGSHSSISEKEHGNDKKDKHIKEKDREKET